MTVDAIPTWSQAPTGTFGELRFIRGSECEQLFIPLPASYETLRPHLARASERSRAGFNVFYGINPRTRQCGRAAGVRQYTAFFVDLDLNSDGDVTRPLQRLGLEPSVTVASGHGLHAYFFLQKPAPVETALPVAKALCRATRSDPVWSPAQATRLPGTVNWKEPCRPRLVSVHAWRAIHYTLDELQQRLPNDVEPELLPASFSDLPKPLPPPVLEALPLPTKLRCVLSNYAVFDRSRADSALALWAVREGWSNERIAALLLSPQRSKTMDRLRQSGEAAASKYAARTIMWARRTALAEVKTEEPHAWT